MSNFSTAVGSVRFQILPLAWLFALLGLSLLLPTRAALAEPGETAPALSPEDLWAAAQIGDLESASRALGAGVPVDAPQRHGMTALMIAAGSGHLELAELLIERGADVNAQESFWGTTALLRALQGQHAEVAESLIEHGASWDSQALYMSLGMPGTSLIETMLEKRRPYAFERDDALALGAGTAPPATLELLRSAEVVDEVPKVELPSSRLESYSGFYGPDGQEDVGEPFEVAITPGGLELRHAGQDAVRLVPLDTRHFRSAPTPDLGVFFLDRAGVVDGFLLLQRDSPPQSLRRIEDAGHKVMTSQPAPAKTHPATRPAAPRLPDRSWPQFRGPGASGVADGQGALVEWDVESRRNVRWRVEVPGLGLSSPVIADGRVFLTTALSGGDQSLKTGNSGDPSSVAEVASQDWQVLAFDTADGHLLWRRSVAAGMPGARRHTKSSHANSTPATDGKRVVALFPTAGLVALDARTGEILWRRDLGALPSGTDDGLFEWGFASSPILWQGLVIAQVDIHGEVQGGAYLAAFDLETGEPRWRTERDEIPTWSTPTVVGDELGGSERAELVTSGTTVRGYDPTTGRELWTLGPMSEIAIATPIAGKIAGNIAGAGDAGVDDGVVFVTGGYPPIRPIYAVRLGQRGDLSLPSGQSHSEAIAWSESRGGGYMPTPIVYRDLLYMPHHNGRLVAYRATDGEVVYRARFSQRGTLSGSPIAGDGLLYFPTEEGLLYVVEAGPKYRELAVHDMGSAILTTPALSAGQLYVRTLDHLWALGRETEAAEAAEAPLE